MQSVSELPTWDLTPIYPGFDSEQYKLAKLELQTLQQRLLTSIRPAWWFHRLRILKLGSCRLSA